MPSRSAGDVSPLILSRLHPLGKVHAFANLSESGDSRPPLAFIERYWIYKGIGLMQESSAFDEVMEEGERRGESYLLG